MFVHVYLSRIGCFSGHRYVVDYLTSIPTIDVNLRGDKHQTALMIACSRGHARIVESLLQPRPGNTTTRSACDITLRDVKGETALFKAVVRGDVQTVLVLLQHIATLQQQQNKE